jgi:glucosamine-6-phosphate isomerase
MELTVFKDHNTLSDHAADKIILSVKQKPDAVLCLAAGDSPKLTYALVAEKAARNKVDFTKCTFIGLDEWVGIGPGNDGSCHYFLRHNVFDPLKISASRIHLFDALSDNLEQQCRNMDNIITAKGGIDLILVGVGMNGHIGFNEPGVPTELYSHVVELDETSRTVGQKYFREQTVLTRGITLGLQHLLQSRCAIMMASGTKKAAVIRKALEEEITPFMPASVIRKHANSYVMLDEGAASALAGR